MTESHSTAPAGRPFVTLNVAESADGKLAPIDGGKINFGSAEDRAQMEALRAEADGVLIGGGTLRAEDPPLIIRDPAVRDRRIAAKGSPHPRNITVCSVLPAQPRRDEFLPLAGDREAGLHHRTDPARPPRSRQPVRPDRGRCRSTRRAASTWSRSLRRLPSLGVRHLLLEGGGELNFSMLRGRPDRRDLPDHLPVHLRRPHRPDLVRRRRLYPRARPQARPQEPPA